MIISEAVFSGSSSSVGGRPSRKASEFAFIGRSNVGKSSLINMLCGRKELAKTSSNPGKTLCINHFLINKGWYLVDLPGYGYARTSRNMRERLKIMIQDYVGMSEDLKMLFVLIDSRHELQEIDRGFIRAVDMAEVPFSIIFTKCDKMGRNAVKAATDRTASQIRAVTSSVPEFFLTSSESGTGRNEILDYIEKML